MEETKECKQCGEEMQAMTSKCQKGGEWSDDSAIKKPMFFIILTAAVLLAIATLFLIMFYVYTELLGASVQIPEVSIIFALAFIASLALAIRTSKHYNRQNAPLKRYLSLLSAICASSIFFLPEMIADMLHSYGYLHNINFKVCDLIFLLISLAFAGGIYWLAYRRKSLKTTFNIFSTVVISMMITNICVFILFMQSIDDFA